MQMTLADHYQNLNAFPDADMFIGHTALLRRLYSGIETYTPSPAEAGRVIHMLPRNLLNRLKGSGVQKDGTTDWRLYHVLDYHYFQRQQFTGNNEQLAARLGDGSLLSTL